MKFHELRDVAKPSTFGEGGGGGVSSCFDQPISYDFDQVVKNFPKNVVDGGVGEFAKKNFRTKGVVIIYGEGGW